MKRTKSVGHIQFSAEDHCKSSFEEDFAHALKLTIRTTLWPALNRATKRLRGGASGVSAKDFVEKTVPGHHHSEKQKCRPERFPLIIWGKNGSYWDLNHQNQAVFSPPV
jgi:hypothetical protein